MHPQGLMTFRFSLLITFSIVSLVPTEAQNSTPPGPTTAPTPIVFPTTTPTSATPTSAPTGNPVETGAPTVPASPFGNTTPRTCTPGTYQLKDQQKLDVTLYFEGGVQADSKFVVTVLDFRKLLKDPNVLSVRLAVGAGTKVINNQTVCPANNCADDRELACVIALAQDEDKLDIVYCYLCGHTVEYCSLGIIEFEIWKLCVQNMSDGLLQMTREAMQKSRPRIAEYPSAVFNDVYDPCTAQAVFEDVTKTLCAMLQPGKGDGACDWSPTTSTAPTDNDNDNDDDNDDDDDDGDNT